MMRRANFVLLLIVAGLATTGCNRTRYVDPGETTAALVATPHDDELRQRLDDIIDYSLNGRLLNSKDHNAWQVVHGIMAYGESFPILHDGETRPAMAWAMSGGDLKGWGLKLGDKGVEAEMLVGGQRVGAGHPDQWLGYMSQSGLPIDGKFVVAGRNFTTQDLLNQAMWNVSSNDEPTWTLMAVTAYLGKIDETWQAKDGKPWSIEKVLAVEVEKGLNGAACFGSHRLFAIAKAVERYLSEKNVPASELTGTWKAADDLIQSAIKSAIEFQQPNGNLSNSFVVRPSSSPSSEGQIYATGHALECLIVAMNQKQFDEPWVTRAAVRLCRLLEQTKEEALECGALYHAAHALILYRQRRFPDAPVSLTPSDQTAAAPAEKPQAE